MTNGLRCLSGYSDGPYMGEKKQLNIILLYLPTHLIRRDVLNHKTDVHVEVHIDLYCFEKCN